MNKSSKLAVVGGFISAVGGFGYFAYLSVSQIEAYGVMLMMVFPPLYFAVVILVGLTGALIGGIAGAGLVYGIAVGIDFAMGYLEKFRGAKNSAESEEQDGNRDG